MKNKREKKRPGVIRRVFRAVGIVLAALLVLVGGLVVFLSVTEYRPAERETLTIEGEAARTPAVGDTISILTWNVGYGALGDNADFFMDGGKGVRTADRARLEQNMAGIVAAVTSVSPDVLFVQEVDRDSARSCRVDELAQLRDAMPGYASAYATNFKVAFVPYPVPPIGRVDSGLATFSSFAVSSAERLQLPVPFKWPVRMANLKRGLLVFRVPVAGTDKELVLVNLHLEAYDDGEGKIAQTRMLADLLRAEAEKGNYVIAGGDFNQLFSSVDASAYTNRDGTWQPGEIDVTTFGEGWQFLMDASVPTCRSLHRPYAGADPADFRYYLIDGFIISDNLTVESVATLDFGFVCSDHNPVALSVTLR